MKAIFLFLPAFFFFFMLAHNVLNFMHIYIVCLIRFERESEKDNQNLN